MDYTWFMGVLLSVCFIIETEAQSRNVEYRVEAEHVWTGWGRWSTCSMTCGDGTKHRRRECVARDRQRNRLVRVKNPTCSGPDKEFIKCQDRRCRPEALDYRQYQCEEHNSDVILDVKYDWLPFYGGPNPCELICMAKGYGFTYHFGHSTDGTPCKKGTNNLCIEGRCVSVGCDGKIGSSAALDNCHVCNGQNRNCAHYRNRFDKARRELGGFDYTEMVKIPSGATKVHVEDYSNNYLAVRDARGTYVLNGRWVVDVPGKYETSRASVVYERTGTNETLDIEGPLNEELYLVLMFRDKNPGVEYSFFLPRNKFKDIVVPGGAGVPQSDAHRPGNDVSKRGSSGWRPHQDTPANRHQSAVGHALSGPSFIGSHTSMRGSSKSKPRNSESAASGADDERYLKQWLKAFSPAGVSSDRGASRPGPQATPWPDPGGPKVQLFTPSPFTERPAGAKQPPPSYPELDGSWGQNVHSFRNPAHERVSGARGPQNRGPHSANPPIVQSGNAAASKPKGPKSDTTTPLKVLQYDRLVEVPEFFRFKKPKHCKPCDKRKRMSKEFCRHSFVVRLKVLDYQYFGNDTRYDMRIMHTYRNTDLTFLAREYMWVPNRCRCPDMRINREYLAMGNLINNYRGSNELRLILDETSYARKFSKGRDQKATKLQKRDRCKAKKG